MKWLKSKWAFLVGVLGRGILNVADRINKTGYSLINYSLKTDPYITDYINFSRNLKDVVNKKALEREEAEEIIAKAQMRKGGCEVQTGNFRRVDCAGDSK